MATTAQIIANRPTKLVPSKAEGNHEQLTPHPSPRTPAVSLGATTDHYMQNKPNFRKCKMNVSTFSQKDYENISPIRKCENKPNQTQFQPKNAGSTENKPNFSPETRPTNPIKANFKRDLVKMGNHETAKGVDTVMEFTLNLIKNSEAKE